MIYFVLAGFLFLGVALGFVICKIAGVDHELLVSRRAQAAKRGCPRDTD